MSAFPPLILRGFPCRVRRENSLVYSSPGGRPLLVDLYIPEGIPRPLPVILWLHAGGWRVGDRHFAPDLSQHFAGRGFVMASIDYRKSKEAKFPAALEDVRAAIRWLRSEAGVYGIDAERIGLWGASAGGHLASLAALSADKDTAVKAVVDAYGPTDFLQMPGHERADSYESKFLGAPLLTVPDLVKQANPITYVTTGAPPFLILHGTADADVSPSQSVLLYEALAAAGNRASLCLIDGLGHGFLTEEGFDPGPARDVKLRESAPGEPERTTNAPPVTFGAIEAFFKRHL